MKDHSGMIIHSPEDDFKMKNEECRKNDEAIQSKRKIQLVNSFES